MSASRLLLVLSLSVLACRQQTSTSDSSQVHGNVLTCSLSSAPKRLSISGRERKHVFESLRDQLRRVSCPSVTAAYVGTRQALRQVCTGAQSCDASDPMGSAEVAKTLADFQKSASSQTLVDEEKLIMNKQLSGPGGSIAGGFYEGLDGRVRYVKTPDDGLQSVSEHLANVLYNDLGIPAAKSTVFVARAGAAGPERLFYASELLEVDADINTLMNQSTERAKATARQFLGGFVADLLLANRDIVSSQGNTVVAKSGQVVRIDSGSSLMMRAMAGRKNAGDLVKLMEWDGFQNSCINWAYARIFQRAAYSQGELCVELKRQIGAISAFAKSQGGWEAYVSRAAPALAAFYKDEFDTSVQMLMTREKLLQQKIAEECRS